jgi:hypothetical protein
MTSNEGADAAAPRLVIDRPQSGTAASGVIQLADATLDFRLGAEERMMKFGVSLPDVGAACVRAARRGLDVVNDEVRIGGVGIVLRG